MQVSRWAQAVGLLVLALGVGCQSGSSVRYTAMPTGYAAPKSAPPMQKSGAAQNREEYNRSEESPFYDAKSSPLATFSVDVDTASYSNIRRILREGKLPPPDAVRI